MVRIRSALSVLSFCVALIGYLSLQPYLDPFAGWFFPAALFFSLYRQARGGALSGRILTPLSVVLFLYFASGFSRENMVLTSTDLLVIFLAIRMLGEKSGRNYLQIFALSLFCLAASSLYNLSALFLFYLLLLLLLLAVSLVLLTFHAHDPELVFTKGELKKVLAISCLIPLLSLPILLIIFLILPRTQYPLWDFLNRGATSVVGFSETVNPGASSSVTGIKSVVLRAICRRVPESNLYWRGIVLNGFRDDVWVRVPIPQERNLRPEPGETVHQEIYPEPSRTSYLPALNIPRQISGVRLTESADAVFQSRRPLEKRVKYEAQSTLSGAIQVQGGIDRNFYLRLPRTLSGRLRAEGRELSRPGAGPEAKLKLLEQFFRARRLTYATTGLPIGSDPLDAFIFDKKRGNCEFFASSAAVLLRLAGVPTRLVGGYRGGSYNDLGGYYLVTEDLAHVWVEAYLEGRGWQTVDPSAWSVGFSHRDTAGRTLHMYLDALGFYWDKAVITYDLEKQIALVRTVAGKARDLHFPAARARHLIALIFLLLPLAVLFTLFLRRRGTREGRMLRHFLRVVRRRYPFTCQPECGLYELAERIDDPHVREFVEIYGKAVYRDERLQVAELARLKKIIRILGQHLP